MRMKKLLMFLVLLTVSVGMRAGVTWTKLADSNSQASNGKGFMYDHTAYLINVENPGDLSSADITAIPQAGNENNKANMNTGTYFEFTGELSAADLAKLDASFGNSSNDVYFDFSNATFSNNVSIANLSSSTLAKYIILPNNTTSIPSEDSSYPESVMEVMAINQSTGSVLAYSDPNSAKTMEKLLAFDYRFKNDAIINCTLVGTYSHNNATSISMDGVTYYDNVFTLLAIGGDGGYKWKFQNFDLTNARFPNYGIQTTYEFPVKITTSTGQQQTVIVQRTEDTNALETLMLYGKRNTLNSLKSVKLPTTAETTLIPHTAFLDCTNLTSLDIPGNIQKLGLSAFSGCSGLTSLTFHEGLTEMSSNVFYNCSSLPTITLPVGLINIGEYAFTNCSSITSIILPEGVKRIQNGAFEMTNIASIHLPSTLEYIEDNVFRQCYNLTTITFPENLKEIGSNCFFNCNKLTDVYFLGTDPNNIPIVPADAFDTKAYNSNNSCANGDKTSTPHTTYGDYDLAQIKGVEWYDEFEFEIDWDNWQHQDGYHAAVLHYPLIIREAEYEPFTSVSDYITANNADEVELYYHDGTDYVKLVGAPLDNVEYFVQAQDAETTQTTSPVEGIKHYYSDAEGNNPTLPQLSQDYYYACGEVDDYAQIDPNTSLDAHSQYYVYNSTSGEYEESDVYFSQNSKYYWYSETETTGTRYVSVSWGMWNSIKSNAPFYTLNNGKYELCLPTFNSATYYYYNENNELTATNGVVELNGNIVLNYYDNNGTEVNPQINDNSGNGYYYKEEYLTHYVPSNIYIPGKTWYINDNGNYTTATISWYNPVDDKSKYYYKKDTKKTVYCTTKDYIAGTTYYTDANGTTEATNLTFNPAVYYFGSSSFTNASSEDVATARYQNTTLFTKDGDTYTKVDADDVVSGGTYYLCTVEGSDDVLGEYYTVPERNATYGGAWVGEDTPEARHNIEGNWPNRFDLRAWLGNGEVMRRSGLPSPDGKNHDGTKNFMLVSGYSPKEQTFEKKYKNVWYTMCFPFNLTKDMLNSAFNPEYEICEFSGVTVDATNKAITLHFTGLVEETDGFMTKAYHPYMIHPNLGPSALNTPSTCTFVGINEIDEKTENVSVGDGSASILGQSVVKSSDSYEGVQGTFTFQGNVSSEKKVIPYGAYFLGTAEGQIYPKFWRESSKVQDRDRGLWSQYSAILLSDQVLEMKMFNNNTSAIDNYVKSFDIDFSDFNSEDALAIEKIVKEAEEKNLPVQYMNIVYDINGKLIQKGDASLENLPSGLYIVNGKKYLVK